MQDKITNQRVICQGGLNTNQNFLQLSMQNPGAATRLVNFESSLSGGYRRISGYSKLNENFGEVDNASAEGAILCITSFNNTDEYIAARKQQSGNTYRFYELTGAGWVAYTTGITHNSSSVTRIRTINFNFRDGPMLAFVDGVNNCVIYNGTTWYALSSSNTGGSGSPGGDQILDAPKYLAVFKNHLFLSGDPTAPNVICHSDPLDGLSFTAAGGGGQITVPFDVVQIAPFRDELYVFGQSAIRKIVPDGANGFIVQDITDDLGCIASDSVVEVGGNLIFLSNDGIRPIAGTDKIGDVDISLLSADIQEITSNLANTYNLDSLKGLTIRNKTQFRYFIGDNNFDRENSYGIIGSVKYNSQGRMWEFGELLGIRASCVWSGYVNGIETVLHGDYNGIVYKQESGNSFDGNNITAIYTTPYIDLGNTEIRKTSRQLVTFIKAEGDYQINIAVRYGWDMDFPNIMNPANYIEESINSTTTYDSTAEFDDSTAIYGGVSQPVIETNIQGSGYSVQFSFVSIDSNPSYTIQGFVYEFTPQGRQ